MPCAVPLARTRRHPRSGRPIAIGALSSVGVPGALIMAVQRVIFCTRLHRWSSTTATIFSEGLQMRMPEAVAPND